MTNKEIAEYKQKLADIMNEFNNLSVVNEDNKQQLIKMNNVIGKFQKLAIDVNAPIQVGKEAIELRREINEVSGKELDIAKFNAIRAIAKSFYQNILYTLQTEMMLNACVFAKWSCICAAVAAIVACISIILTMCLN
jgi:hypothetical protein